MGFTSSGKAVVLTLVIMECSTTGAHAPLFAVSSDYAQERRPY